MSVPLAELIDPEFVKEKLGDLGSAVGSPGSTPPGKGIVVLGYDGTNLQRLKATSDGKLVLYLD